MTIDEAIKHCLEVAEQQEADSFIDRWSDADEWSESLKENCRQCAADHRQLAEWLTELKELSLQQNAPRLGSIEEYHFELARCKTAFWSCNKRCMDAEEQYRRKADELRKAQEQISEYKRLLKAVKWISVKDRLPENNKLVLCYAHSTTGEGNSYFLGAVAHGEFWFLKVNDIGHVSCPVLHWEVTHWLPLPEPPKG